MNADTNGAQRSAIDQAVEYERERCAAIATMFALIYGGPPDLLETARAILLALEPDGLVRFTHSLGGEIGKRILSDEPFEWDGHLIERLWPGIWGVMYGDDDGTLVIPLMASVGAPVEGRTDIAVDFIASLPATRRIVMVGANDAVLAMRLAAMGFRYVESGYPCAARSGHYHAALIREAVSDA